MNFTTFYQEVVSNRNFCSLPLLLLLFFCYYLFIWLGFSWIFVFVMLLKLHYDWGLNNEWFFCKDCIDHEQIYFLLLLFFNVIGNFDMFLGGELWTIKSGTRSCLPAAAAFLVQKILQVFSLTFLFLLLYFHTNILNTAIAYHSADKHPPPPPTQEKNLHFSQHGNKKYLIVWIMFFFSYKYISSIT